MPKYDPLDEIAPPTILEQENPDEVGYGITKSKPFDPLDEPAIETPGTVFRPAEPEAPRARETLTRQLLDAVLPPSPEDVEHRNLPSYTDEGLRGMVVEHLVKPGEVLGGLVKEKVSGLAEPIAETSSVPWNFITGIPGTLAETAGEFGGSLLEDAPVQVGLGAVGEGMQGLGAFKKAAGALEEVAPWMVHRGGELPTSKLAGDILDTSKMKQAEELNSIMDKFITSPEGKALGAPDRQLIGALMEEPKLRELFAGLGDTPPAPPVKRLFGNIGPIPGEGIPTGAGFESLPQSNVIPSYLKNRIKKLYKETDVPGLTKINTMPPAVAQAMQTELAMPVATHAKIAEELSQVFYSTKPGSKGLAQELVELGAASPDTFNRFTNQYLPWVRAKVVDNLAGDVVETMPNAASKTVFGGGSRGVRLNKNFLKKRGEMTEETRINEGFLPAEQSVAIRFMQEKTLVNNQRYFNTLARDPNVVRPIGQFENIPMGSSKGGWTHMPNDKAYGPLQGMMVRTAEANDVMAAQKFAMNAPKVMKKWWSLWKFSKTVVSPKTHIRNFMSNGMLAHAAGLSPWRMDIYREAANELAKGGKWMDEIKNLGSVGGEWAYKTGAKGTMMGEILGDASNIYESGFNSIPQKIMGSKSMKALADTYQESERLFKHAIYIYLRRNGVAIDEAMQRASFGIINYDKMPYWLKELRSNPLGVPFISYTYGSVGPLAQALMEKPQLYAQYYIVADAWNRMAAEAVGAKPDEVDKMEALSNGTAPVLWPFRDASGGLLTTDISPMAPTGPLIPGRRSIGLGEEAGALMGSTPAGKVAGKVVGAGAGLAESTLLSNPILSELMAQVTGVDPYFKQKFAEPMGSIGQVLSDTRAQGEGNLSDKYGPTIVGEAMRKRLSRFARTTLPELLGGGFSQNMIDAIRGKEGMLGDKLTVPEVVESYLSPSGRLTPLAMQNIYSLLSESKLPALAKSAETSKYKREKGRKK